MRIGQEERCTGRGRRRIEAIQPLRRHSLGRRFVDGVHRAPPHFMGAAQSGCAALSTGFGRLLKDAGGGGKERKGFALSRSPTRVDMYVDDFPGPLKNFPSVLYSQGLTA
jgi:hypothetical protein